MGDDVTIDKLLDMVLRFFSISKLKIDDRIEANSFSIQQPKLGGISTGSGYETIKILIMRPHVRIFPSLSYFNHSCSPNCTFYAGGNRDIIVQSTRAIQEGEEVTISYNSFNDFSDHEKRVSCKAYIDAHYFFECGCS